MAVAEQELVTFAQFEGKVDGNTVKGVSIIQEGPALGHGVWVDKKALEQVKRLATESGRIKAKLNHWSNLQDTIGYYENFRIRSGKLVADLTLFESHGGKALLLEMIEQMPKSFGVSIMFRSDEPEYDNNNDRYNTRVRELYSADFVDTPAVNRDGVFEVEIDSAETIVTSPTTPPDAFDAKAAIVALEDKLSALTSALEALKPKEPVAAPPAPVEVPAAFTAQALQDAVTTALKVHFSAPQTNQQPAPPNEQEPPAEKPKLATYAEARTAFIGDATGIDRTRRAMAFEQDAKNRPAHLA